MIILAQENKIGTFRPTRARFYLDSDGNGSFEPGIDSVVIFGAAGDAQVTGDWNGDGTDDVGVFRASPGKFLMDANGNGVWDGTASGDKKIIFGTIGDIPLAGDWNGDGIDDFGIFRPSEARFLLDANGNGVWDDVAGGDKDFQFGRRDSDIPLVGDWNGDGIDDIGVYRPSRTRFLLDLNSNSVWDGVSGGDNLVIFGSPNNTPIIGDWNADGTDDIGVYRSSQAKFLLDANGNNVWDGTGGGDSIYIFGSTTDNPISGNW